MKDKIYLLQGDGSLQPMSEEAYDSEDLLQRLLEQYPALLAGEQIDEASPRRWLLVSREYSVPGELGGGERWSLDHLFLDQDAIPTLIEVKRSSDSRIRREVVGQMLDYGANAVVYWPVEGIRAKFEARCEAEGDDPQQVLAELLEITADDGETVEQFWTRVKTNLQAGRVRMVFVADEIPGELRRIVEFLNTQMDPAEVLAIEVRQFVGQGLKTLVPKLVGQTAAATRKKSGGKAETFQWSEETFIERIREDHGAGAANVAAHILEWIRPRVTRVWWGKGAQIGSMVPILELGGGRGRGGHQVHFFAVWTYGVVEIYCQYLRTKPGFERDEKRRELLERLNQIPGVELPLDGISRLPRFPIGVLESDDAMKQFQRTIEWGIEEVFAAAGERGGGQ